MSKQKSGYSTQKAITLGSFGPRPRNGGRGSLSFRPTLKGQQERMEKVQSSDQDMGNRKMPLDLSRICCRGFVYVVFALVDYRLIWMSGCQLKSRIFSHTLFFKKSTLLASCISMGIICA